MNTNPVVVEQLYDTSVEKVWTAITDAEEMKKWYFHLHEFKPEVGFQFQFTGGTEEGVKYLHLCEITECISQQKLTHTWCYDGYEGVSYVSFELYPKDGKTLLKLTHSGLETFPADNPDFAANNFQKGWNEIIGHSLKTYLHSIPRG